MLVDGPWTHRFVGANGSRFHVVEAGTGPAGAVPARFSGVLVGVARDPAGGGRRRFPRGRGRPARVRRQRQAPSGVRRLHDGRRRHRPDPGTGRADGDDRRQRLRRDGRLDGGGVPPQAGPPARRARRRPPAAPARGHLRRPARPVQRGVADACGSSSRATSTCSTRDEAALVGEFLRRWGGPSWVAGADLRRLRGAVPGGDADPAGGVLRAGRLPVGVPLGAAHCTGTGSCDSCRSRW